VVAAERASHLIGASSSVAVRASRVLAVADEHLTSAAFENRAEGEEERRVPASCAVFCCVLTRESIRWPVEAVHPLNSACCYEARERGPGRAVELARPLKSRSAAPRLGATVTGDNLRPKKLGGGRRATRVRPSESSGVARQSVGQQSSAPRFRSFPLASQHTTSVAQLLAC
jgi:hypothetical protein